MNILKGIYKEIEESYKFEPINYSFKEKNIYELQITQPKSMPFNYIPQQVREHILKNSRYEINYSFIVGKRECEIFFIMEEQLKSTDIHKYIKVIVMWLYILEKFAPPQCSKVFKGYFYMTSLEKHLPEKSDDVIDEIHSNTAFTRSCSADSEIILFRKEEWFKVFIHETFHSFGLDFSEMDVRECHLRILSTFKIKSQVNLFEAYTEFWAEIINSLFCSFFSKKSLAYYIEKEKDYSFFQMNKVLTYMGISYEDLFDKTHLHIYKENTNVFSYYILKTILMNNYIKFLEWCNQNNGTQNVFCFKKTKENLNNFCKFIEDNYKDPTIINSINEAKIKSKILNNNKYITTNMRMSISDLFG